MVAAVGRMSNASPQEPARGGTFASLRYAPFRHLWFGQIFHAGGVWMSQIALPFLIFDLTGDKAVHLGAIIGIRTIPQVIFGLIAGVVSDWFDRRNVLMATKLSVFAVAVIFAGLIVSGHLELWHVYVYAFSRGTLIAFDQPARQSMIPSIVPAERVTNAMALMSATLNTMRIAGATLGGLIYAATGAAGAFSLMAVFYGASAFFTYLLRVPTQQKPEGSGLAAMGRGLVEGLRFAVGNAPVRGVLALSAVYFTFGMSYMQVFLPLFAEDVLKVGSGGYGVLSAFTGAGALTMAMFIARSEPKRLGLLLPWLVACFGATTVAFALSTFLPRPWGLLLPFAVITVVGGLQTAFFSLGRVLMLHASPEQMRGRVLSLFALDRAFMSAGASIGGLLAAAIGVQYSQLLYGSLCIAGGLGVYLLATSFRGATTDNAAESAVAAGGTAAPAA